MIDARDVASGALLTADICVVGAGACGTTLAAELDGGSRDVLLVESGGLGPDEETQSLYEIENAGYPIRENFMSRARYYGGSCNLWAGRNMLIEPIDCSARSRVPAGGWPIPYEEIASYHSRAGRALRLPPVEAFDEAAYSARMSGDERALFAPGPLRPVISLWATKPVRFGSAHKKRLRRSRGTRLLLHASVVHACLNREGTVVDSLEARTTGGKRIDIRAKTFVFACGGLENARLLLVTRERSGEAGAGRWDALGRFFMDHPRAVFGTVRLRKGNRLPLIRGIPLRDGKVQFGVGLSEETQRNEGLLNHYATLEAQYSAYVEQKYQTVVQSMKVLLRRGYAGSRWKIGRAELPEIPGMIYLLTPKELMPHFVYRWTTTLRRALNPESGGNNRVVVYFCEQPPDPESRVTLCDKKDALGVPRLRLHWRISPEVTRTLFRLQEILGDHLEKRGIGTLEPGEGEPRFSDASHHLGTTRMADDPGRGVVDRDCRVHGIRNLYFAGGSIFPAAGHSSPTLTMIALTLRLADHLAGTGARS
ncbi:MAG: GMC oxidoreductase [Candidatus Eisenbacteria bacterium]